MKIAIIGGIHSDGLKLLEKSNFEIFEISNFEESNLINELKDIDGIILRTATVTPDVLKCCNKITNISTLSNLNQLKTLLMNNSQKKVIRSFSVVYYLQ